MKHVWGSGLKRGLFWGLWLKSERQHVRQKMHNFVMFTFHFKGFVLSLLVFYLYFADHQSTRVDQNLWSWRIKYGKMEKYRTRVCKSLLPGFDAPIAIFSLFSRHPDTAWYMGLPRHHDPNQHIFHWLSHLQFQDDWWLCFARIKNECKIEKISCFFVAVKIMDVNLVPGYFAVVSHPWQKKT